MHHESTITVSMLSIMIFHHEVLHISNEVDRRGVQSLKSIWISYLQNEISSKNENGVLRLATHIQITPSYLIQKNEPVSLPMHLTDDIQAVVVLAVTCSFGTESSC